MNSSFTAAATGLHIGLLICLCMGCEQPGPTVQQTLEDVQVRLSDLETARAQEHQEFEAAIKAFSTKADAAVDEYKSTVSSLLPKKGEHSILSPEQQRERFESDFPAVAKVVFEPKSCPLPEVGKADLDKVWSAIEELKPTKRVTAKPKSKPAGWQAAIDSATANLVVFAVRQNRCPPCDNFELNALGDSFNAGIESRNATLRYLNVDKEPDAKEHFKIGGTPWLIVFDKSTEHWHGMLADGNDSPEQALSLVDQCIAAIKLGDEAPPRPRSLKRLFN